MGSVETLACVFAGHANRGVLPNLGDSGDRLVGRNPQVVPDACERVASRSVRRKRTVTNGGPTEASSHQRSLRRTGGGRLAQNHQCRSRFGASAGRPGGGACLSLIVGLKSRISKGAREATMRISVFCTAIVAYVVMGHPPPAVAQVDQQRAQEYFKEAQALCERDGGRLWGVSLWGPMVIADAATGTTATSEPASAGEI